MTKLLTSLVVIVVLMTPAIAQECTRAKEHTCSTEPDEASLLQHCCYMNRFGHEEHAPAQSPKTPQRATALCQDGFYSFSEHRDGTCSHHHGVRIWLRTAHATEESVLKALKKRSPKMTEPVYYENENIIAFYTDTAHMACTVHNGPPATFTFCRQAHA